MIAINEFRVVPEFAPLTDEELSWVAEHAELQEVPAGEQPFAPGAPADHMILVLKGSMELSVSRGASWEVFGVFDAGSITGLLPYSRMTHFFGRAVALKDMRLACIPKECLPEMVYRIQALGQPLIARMSDRVRLSERGQSQQEKMMALGKLSAGLAHELNNPAAAVRRAAETLRTRLDELPPLVGKLIAHGLRPEQIDVAEAACTLGGKQNDALSSLERSDKEEDLIDWLSDHDVEEAWDIAPTLVDAGLNIERVTDLTAHVPRAALSDVLAWLSASVSANRLLVDLADAADRISELVTSIKSYTHMDRAPEKQSTDVRSGISNTLTMLGHKLRRKAIQVQEDFPESLPDAPAYPGALNQVWTNLIDNAIDAMDDGGQLRIEGKATRHALEVRIQDNGSGIPEDVQKRIFEPFFTTKGVGEGTGLGLDIVHRIVVGQHTGTIRVDSAPGRTVFTVRLPLPE